MKSTILIIIDLIKEQGLRRFLFIICALISVLFFEIISLAQVYPFIQLLTDGEKSNESIVITLIKNQFGNLEHAEFIKFSAVILLVSVLSLLTLL